MLHHIIENAFKGLKPLGWIIQSIIIIITYLRWVGRLVGWWWGVRIRPNLLNNSGTVRASALGIRALLMGERRALSSSALECHEFYFFLSFFFSWSSFLCIFRDSSDDRVLLFLLMNSINQKMKEARKEGRHRRLIDLIISLLLLQGTMYQGAHYNSNLQQRLSVQMLLLILWSSSLHNCTMWAVLCIKEKTDDSRHSNLTLIC